MDVNPSTGPRKYALCPKCGSLERHRMQYLVVKSILKDMNVSKMKMLHFAPEIFFRDCFSKWFGRYETADLNMKGVDHNVDLQYLPFDDSTYDFVFASHVLEHVPNDCKAIEEICRVLNPNETYHVRAPGMDYFTRYEDILPGWKSLLLTRYQANISYLFMKIEVSGQRKNALSDQPCRGRNTLMLSLSAMCELVSKNKTIVKAERMRVLSELKNSTEYRQQIIDV